MAPHRPNFGRDLAEIWPTSTEHGQVLSDWAKFDQVWVDFGRLGAEVGKFRPNVWLGVDQFGPKPAQFGTTSTGKAKKEDEEEEERKNIHISADVCLLRAQFDRIRAAFGRTFTDFGQIWATRGEGTRITFKRW